MPAPQPVAPDTYPSIPAATRQQPAQTVPSPAQASQPLPQAAPEVQQTNPPVRPANPLDAPIAPAAPPAAPSQPYNNPLDQPITPSSGAPVAPAPPSSSPTANPLEQPVTVQPAQPPEAQPVQIAPPSPVASLPSIPTEYPALVEAHKDYLGSAYIPDDSWVYPQALRLYSMGYLPSAFISMRPWTRRSLLHMLEKSQADVLDSNNQQAMDIFAKLKGYVSDEIPGPANTESWAMTRGAVYGVDTVYSRFMGIQGLSLRDSYNLGQTIVNDYGRPYQPGFNDVTGFSTTNEWNRFTFYVRGEYQHAPSATGYNFALSQYLSSVAEIPAFAPPNEPTDIIPFGPLAAANPFRLQEAYLSFHLLGHEISGGKTDAWLGPGQGGAMAWSNNAEDIYSFRINRIEPMHIPYFSKIVGPLRYDFFVGSLKGHTYPNSPWVHSEMFSLRPTNNFEFSFQRTVIWGGEGHVPVTLHTFFRSFFSFNDVQGNEKNSSADPGARFAAFNFSWRLPYLRTVTLYADSEAHDDVTPPSAPRRAAYRPGLYISQLPGAPKFDLRLEAASTDCSTLRCTQGIFQYFEGVQRDGYTNKGFIMGDWVGREAIAYQGWLTYHLSGDEWVQASYMHKMTPQDFIGYGVSQSDAKVEVVKRLRPDVELDAWYQFEHWTAPVYKTTQQTNNVFTFQFTFSPKLHDHVPHLNGK